MYYDVVNRKYFIHAYTSAVEAAAAATAKERVKEGEREREIERREKQSKEKKRNGLYAFIQIHQFGVAFENELYNMYGLRWKGRERDGRWLEIGMTSKRNIRKKIKQSHYLIHKHSYTRTNTCTHSHSSQYCVRACVCIKQPGERFS